MMRARKAWAFGTVSFGSLLTGALASATECTTFSHDGKAETVGVTFDLNEKNANGLLRSYFYAVKADSGKILIQFTDADTRKMIALVSGPAVESAPVSIMVPSYGGYFGLRCNP